MTLEQLYPFGYLVAKAWRTWFDTDRPPFVSIEDLGRWKKQWNALAEAQFSGSLHLPPHLFTRWVTAILGFWDKPQHRPARSALLWANADRRTLQAITADRHAIAVAMRHSDEDAGLFVLTGWVRQGEWQDVLRLMQTSPQPALPLPPQEAKALMQDPLFPAARWAEKLREAVTTVKVQRSTRPAQQVPAAVPEGEQAVTPAPEQTRASEPKPVVPAKPYGPTEKTIELAESIKELKDQHPTWSQSRVATELCLPIETIRNAYRLMGWKWERADRVRVKR